MKLKELIKTSSEPIIAVNVIKEEKLLLSFFDSDILNEYVGDYEVINWRVVSGNEINVQLKTPLKEEKKSTLLVSNNAGVALKEISNKMFLEALPTQDPCKYDDYDIRNLRLGKVTLSKLSAAGITKIKELRELTVEDIKRLPRIGKGRVNDIRRALYEFNCHLKDDFQFNPNN